MGARNQVGTGLSYQSASICSLATQFQNRFLESILRDPSFRLWTQCSRYALRWRRTSGSCRWCGRPRWSGRGWRRATSRHTALSFSDFNKLYSGVLEPSPKLQQMLEKNLLLFIKTLFFIFEILYKTFLKYSVYSKNSVKSAMWKKLIKIHCQFCTFWSK